MARNVYNPILHIGGKISSRDQIYDRDVADSGGDKNISDTRFIDPTNQINNNSLSYTNSSNVIIDRNRQGGQNVEVQATYDAGGVVYKQDTTSANGPYKRPQTVNGPLISPLAIAQVWTAAEQSGELPYLGDPCDLDDNGDHDPANPCFQCYNGYWIHMDYISPMGECGEWREVRDVGGLLGKVCEQHYYDVGPCFECFPETGVKPLCESECEKCVEVQGKDGTIRGSCENACLNIEQLPPGRQPTCINNQCYDTCYNPEKPTAGWEDTCNKNLCQECVNIDTGHGRVGACLSYCGIGQRCVNGRCVDDCWPHCQSCEECVFRDGVYGCELLQEYTEYLGLGYEVVCCNDGVTAWKSPCESLGPDCTVVDECVKQGKICVREYGDGATIPTFSCKDKCRLDSDCGPCEACDDTSVYWGRCYSVCEKRDPFSNKRGQFCDNGTCRDAPYCKSCEKLTFICDSKDKLKNYECWQCVDNCPQDVLPLQCLPVPNGKPGEHACQYMSNAIILADLVDTIP